MRRYSPRWMAQAGAAMVALALTVVYRFSPGSYGFYPSCPIATWLHVECPGCGSTRALHALLHLRLEEAAGWNPFFPWLFAAAMTWGVVQYATATWQDRFVQWKLPETTYWAAATGGMAMFVMRNIF